MEHSLDQYKFRRANIDDLEVLSSLWERHDFDPILLEQRLTEFHIAEDESGELQAAVGIKVVDRQGLIHHECWSSGMTLHLRKELAVHALNVCETMQVWRIWTCLKDTHWEEMGFDAAPQEIMDQLPPGFGDWRETWKFQKIKDDLASNTNLARQFEILKIENDESNVRLKKTGQIMKFAGYFIVTCIVIAVIFAAVSFFSNSNG